MAKYFIIFLFLFIPGTAQGAFGAYLSSNQDIASSTGFKLLEPDTIDYDDYLGGYFNLEQSRFYASTTGVYVFSASGHCYVSGACNTNFFVNGERYAQGTDQPGASSGGQHTGGRNISSENTQVISLTSGDYVDVRIYTISGNYATPFLVGSTDGYLNRFSGVMVTPLAIVSGSGGSSFPLTRNETLFLSGVFAFLVSIGSWGFLNPFKGVT